MSEFIEFLYEVFSNFGTIKSRKMFGGYGIYHKGLMFGLVTDDSLYLKADETTKQLFIDKVLTPFEYDKKQESTIIIFPRTRSCYDDPDVAVYWTRLAYQAALNSKSTRKKIH